MSMVWHVLQRHGEKHLFRKDAKGQTYTPKKKQTWKKCHPKTRVVFRPLRLRCFLLVGGRLAQKFVSQKFAANRMWNNVSSCQHFCWMVFEARILSTGISQEWCEMNVCIFLVFCTYFHTGYLGFYNPLPYCNFWDISTRGSNLHRPTDKSLSVEVDRNEKTPSAWRRNRWGWIQKLELRTHSAKWATKRPGHTFHYAGCWIGILTMVYFIPIQLSSIFPCIP